ncbi:hypothetical protein JOE11_005080 [Robbsia andropogonis]|uniref:hypothetical protein n=1 Tax=Robbsia andropogonis TaxID=28092 RepID=UPI002A6A61C1|nr:hypothetical protein [Robbsia andropogonis]
MFIVEIGNGSGDYAVFELLSATEVEVGDKLRGDLDSLGGENLRNLRTGQSISVYGQSGPSTLLACRRLM